MYIYIYYLTPSYKMSHRFCSTRIRSHPLARFALYRMVGTGGGYTRTILGSLGSNLQQPGQPESRCIEGMGKPQWDSKRLTWGAWANCC